VVTHQLQVKRRTGKVRRPETDVLPLCHATNHQGSPGQRAIKRVCVYLITLHCNTVHKMCNQLTWCTARLHRSQNRMTFAFWHSPSMHIAHTASSSMEIDKPREGLSDDRVRKNASFSNLSIKASNISCTTGASDFPSRCSLANSNQM